MSSVNMAPDSGGWGHSPIVEGPWVRPADTVPAEPRWGHAAGLQLGLAPLPGPRGLLRVYAPYLGHPPERLVNFIAVEPTPVGATRRGLSELEWSALDGERGKRMWSADRPTEPGPADPRQVARGVVSTVDGVGRLTVYLLVERFDNGADVYLRATFTEDRPHEVALAAYRREESVELATLSITATMGNFARLRRLHLAGRTVTPDELWPGFSGDGFTAHARFGLDVLARDAGGAATVTATPDEADPTLADYADDTHEHWKYTGLRAVQGWRVDAPRPGLAVLVNGRWAYWASSSPIPGGVAYENFELAEPFAQGQEYVFSVEPLP
jgi:hypothetical protein